MLKSKNKYCCPNKIFLTKQKKHTPPPTTTLHAKWSVPYYVAFTFICSHIQTANAYGVCFSQLVRYSRACDFYHGVLHRGLLLTNEGVLKVKLVPMVTLLFEKHPIHVFKVQQLYPLICYLVIGDLSC